MFQRQKPGSTKKTEEQNWLVSIPITGYVTAVVRATSEREAIDKAFERDYEAKDIEEWELHETIVEGNCFHGRINTSGAEPTDEELSEEQQAIGTISSGPCSCVTDQSLCETHPKRH